jgi:crotonobetainyl-CoA:carnitine CoA-transferase CaiB-like acyl-CoA transferase
MATNPIGTHYATADGRWIMLSMLESQRWWAPLCRALGHEELVDDPRFADAAARAQHADACRAILAAIFAGATLAQWRDRLAALIAPWEAVADSAEVAADPQALANGYLTLVEHPSGETLRVVRGPVTFDGTAPDLGVAPEFGQHTEEILVELGHNWEEITAMKESGTIP